VKSTSPYLACRAVFDEGACAAQHFGRCAAGKGEEQNPIWLHTALNEMRNSCSQRSRLSCACASNDQHWTVTVRNGISLLRVQTLEVGRDINDIEHMFDTSHTNQHCD